MAKAFLFALCAFGLVACGGGGGGGPIVKLDGGKQDLTTTPQPDLKMAQPDLTMTGGTLTCGDIIDCVNGCTSQMCFDDCVKMGTAPGRQKFIALLQCLETACPSTNNGVCDSKASGYNKANCDACYSKAQMSGGACFNQLQACGMDM